jgi:predicted nucleotidyltransferase
MSNNIGTPSVDISLWEATLAEKYRQREGQRQQILADAINALKIYFRGKQVSKVYLTGSILRKGKYYPFSDLDIAVEGLEEDYFETLVQLEDLLGRDVDLIELESCRFSQEIQERGLKIL